MCLLHLYTLKYAKIITKQVNIMQKNFIFISPNFPKTYYQFPLAWKQLGGRSLAISDANYNSLSDVQKSAFDDYYQVSSLENYDEVYRGLRIVMAKLTG